MQIGFLATITVSCTGTYHVGTEWWLFYLEERLKGYRDWLNEKEQRNED